MGKVEATSRSYAKINLFLYITGKRSDGYHNIFSLLHRINLYDIIKIEKSSHTLLTCNDEKIPVDDRNIILKVDAVLRDKYRLVDNYKISLEKNIPSGAGLGGGSSNAHTYLKLVNSLSSLDLSIRDMHFIMESVGSDTPFFLYEPSAFVWGRGDIVKPFKGFNKILVLIVNPGIEVNTSEIYKDKNLEIKNCDLCYSDLDGFNLDILEKYLFNGLQNAVFTKYPILEDIRQNIINSGSRLCLMSGSGPTIFGIYNDPIDFEYAYNYLKQIYPGYYIEKV